LSLILEALKKLERDRRTQDRGFLVLAQPAWKPDRERHWLRGGVLLAGAAVAGGALAYTVLRHRSPPAATVAPAAPPVTAAAAPAPSTLAPAPQPSPSKPPGTRVTWRWHGANAATNPNEQIAQPAAARPAGVSNPPATPPPVATTPAAPPAVAAGDEPEPEPAEPAAAAPPPAGPLRLEAIAERDGQPVAVVSGQVVRVGDRIGSSTVIRIGTAEIELETDGLRRILRF
jgi:hypothetical protein